MYVTRIVSVLAMVALSLVGPATATHAADDDGVQFTWQCAPGSPPEATYYVDIGRISWRTCADGPVTTVGNSWSDGSSYGGSWYVMGTPVPIGAIPTVTGAPALVECSPAVCDGRRPPPGTCATGTGYGPDWDCSGPASFTDVTITMYWLPTRAVTAFGPPVNAQPTVNVAQAGRALPFKFTVTDSTGAAVTDLAEDDVTLSSRLHPCNDSAATDVLESYAAGAGLQNQGNGSYQYVFKTPKTWAGTCGELSVSAGAGHPDRQLPVQAVAAGVGVVLTPKGPSRRCAVHCRRSRAARTEDARAGRP